MNSRMLLFQLTIRWILLTVVSANIFPALERGATDVAIDPGENAMFECDLKHTGGYPIVWFHQETGRYIDGGFINSGSQDHTRYHTAQNLSAETYKLWIMDVRFSDTGTYACVWKGKCAIPMDWVHLTVIGAPTIPTDDQDYTRYSSSHDDDDDDDTKFPSTDNNSLDPICEISTTSDLQDINDNLGQDFILICKSPPQIPRSTVEWYRNDAESMMGPFDTNVVYQRYLTQQDVDATFTCVLRSPSLPESRNCSVGPVRRSSASISFSRSSHGNPTFASISATLGVVCVILVAGLLYVVISNKKKRTVSYQEVSTVSAHMSPSPEGYMALENQYQPPKYQPLKAPSKERVTTRKPTIEPPPRKARKPKYPPPKHKSSAIKQTPNTNSNATYAVPNISYLSVPVNIKHSRDNVSEHSYEVPPC